jgi:F-type H+-transporting ATPase subunit delta
LIGNIVARRYAKALFAVAKKQSTDALDAFGKQLTDLAVVLEGAPEALRLFRNPSFSADEKKAVLGTILEKISAKPEMRNFCEFLADKGRLGFITDICATYGELLDEAKGVIRGKLVTAMPIPEARQSQIKAKLESQTGKKITLAFEADKQILGGVLLKVGDRVLDASLRAQLQILKETIKRGE